MSAPCGCTAVWGWSPARKSFWSAGGITYDASLEFGTCAHRNVLQRPDTNFRMQGRAEEGWLPGKEPAPELVIEYTMTDEPRPDEDVLVAARGQKWAVGEGINPGQIAQGVWVTTHRGERRVLILADLAYRHAGYVKVTVLNRNGDVLTSHHCTECGAGAGEGALHRGGEKCPGLQRMRQSHGLKPIEAGYSCLDAVKETRLRPYKSERAVMMVDDMSEPP